MAMKKKLLGLALAGAMVLPSTGAAFANPVDVNVPGRTIGGSVEHELKMDITVKDDNNDTQNQIIVEIPSKLAFAVGTNGQVGQQTLTIKNESKTEDVAVSVERFVDGTTGGIEVVTDVQDPSQTPRSNIALKLMGNKTLNLGEIVNKPDASTNPNAQEILTVEHGKSESLTLTGESGTKAGSMPQSMTEQFSLVFKLEAK